MIVDSSALLAVLYREPDAERYETAIRRCLELPHVSRQCAGGIYRCGRPRRRSGRGRNLMCSWTRPGSR